MTRRCPRNLGPAGLRVASNLRALRKAQGVTHARLAARLAELGHPLAASALSKIENGDRRIDIDDLANLALALDVDPGQLVSSQVVVHLARTVISFEPEE